MKCEEFRNRIEELFDATDIDSALHEHLNNCYNCYKYYKQFEYTVAMLTPHHAPVIPEKCDMKDLQKNIKHENMKNRKTKDAKRFTKRIWQLTSAAAITVFIVCGIFIYNITTTKAIASTASDILTDAIKNMHGCTDFSTILMVRTLPSENFNYIDANAPFVEHQLCVGHNGKQRIWSMNKGRVHYVLHDGNAQYQWWKGSKKAFIQSADDNIIDYFSFIVDMPKLMKYECERTKLNDGDTYNISHNDSIITLNIKSGARFKPHILLRDKNCSLDYLPNIREYKFHATTYRLLSMRYWVKTDKGEKLIIESKDFKYGNEAILPQTSIPSKNDYEWTDVRAMSDVKPDRNSMLRTENPKTAALRIMDAIISKDSSKAREALISYETDKLFEQFDGYILSGCKKIFHSDGYCGVYAIIELMSPDGKHETIQIALRNDNEYGIWILDGGV